MIQDYFVTVFTTLVSFPLTYLKTNAYPLYLDFLVLKTIIPACGSIWTLAHFPNLNWNFSRSLHVVWCLLL